MSAGPHGDTPWRSARAQVLVEDLGRPTLDDDAAHHLRRVLRLETGAQVCAYDGAGSFSLGLLGTGSELEEPTAAVATAPPSAELTVGFAALKGSRTELVVQKLTEVGADRIWVLETRRSVVRWDDRRAAKHLERLRRVAAEACAQCRRLRLPTVEVRDLAGAVGEGAVLADARGRPLSGTDHTVLIGPEGGWDDSEVGDADTVALAGNVLRAETAAIVAGSAMARLRDGY